MRRLIGIFLLCLWIHPASGDVHCGTGFTSVTGLTGEFVPTCRDCSTGYVSDSSIVCSYNGIFGFNVCLEEEACFKECKNGDRVFYPNECPVYVTCAAGTYLPANGTACAECPAGPYCAGGTFAAAATVQGIAACPAGYDDGPAGATSEAQCQIKTTPGYYIATAGDATETECGRAFYCPSTTITYGSTGGRVACPDTEAHKRTTFPDNYYSPTFNYTLISGMINTASLITDCRVLSEFTTSRGEFYEYANYNTASNMYDTTFSYGWQNVNPGYYLTDRASCGANAYYHTVKECPVGSYCPGKTEVLCNSSNVSVVHTETFGLESCPAGATSPAGSTSIDACSCADGTQLNSAGTCSALCAAGVTTWRTGSGIIVSLFATKNTTPSVNFGIGESICYADLVEGTTTNAIHVEYNGKVYHTVN